jgi:hypothetical protein
MTPTLAIDPGTTQSQYLVWDGANVVERAFLPNLDVLEALPPIIARLQPCVCIEGVASYGMAVGREVFETCIWIGRFYQQCVASGRVPEVMFRAVVKLHLCHTPKAKDANIRQALIDRFGGKETAIGKKKTPGPLYGISSHAWAALALAVTFTDQQKAA